MVQQLLNGSLAKGVSGDDQPYDEAWVQAVLDQEFVTVFDAYHVRLNLMTPTTQFYPVMAGPWAGIISPAATIEMDYEAAGWDFDAEQTPSLNFTKYYEHMAGKGDTGLVLPENGWEIGTGPYYVESVEPAAPYTITLKAYDDYWGGPDNMNLPPAGKTRIETIEFKYIPSFTTRLLDLDVTMHGPFSQFTTWWLCFNTNVTNPEGTLKDWQPFADWRIRMAAACSVNITEMNINMQTTN
jgi:ABC-type transport system substrate-binding protein